MHIDGFEGGKKIPISTAKKIASDFGYTQVVVHAFDGLTGIQHVTTYGKSQADCENAAAGGNAIKKLLKWDEKLCNAKPARQIKREKFEKMEEIIKSLAEVIDSPNSDDRVNLVRFVAISAMAKKI